jgi:hypothetical protein
VDQGDSGHAFLAFLRANEGAKIRLLAYLDSSLYEGVPDNRQPTEGGFWLPSEDCPDKPFAKLTDQDCALVHIDIRSTSTESVGLWYQHGTWHLQGYFANHGYVDTWMGVTTYAITTLSDVEAVS